MSKFGGLDYMIVLNDPGTSGSSKNIISDSAMDYANERQIPLARRFSTRKRETSKKNWYDLRPFNYNGKFSPLAANCLKPVTIKDKLFIVAHADEEEVGPMSAMNLAGMLKSYGLSSVGLITFKACNVGTGGFLEDFVAATTRYGIIIGWVKGYRGSASTVHGKGGGLLSDDDPSPGHVTEMITFEQVNPDTNEMATYRRLGDSRYKIVRAPNNPFVGTFGRYS